MNVLTLGWISVFIYILFMNLYIWSRYWSIPFLSYRLIKVSSYLSVQIILIILTLYYFYLFFNGKAELRRARLLSLVAGFYIIVLHYAFVFYLVHDLANLSTRWIACPLRLRLFGGKLFYGGFIIFITGAIIAIYGLMNAKRVVIKEYDIVLPQKKSTLTTLNVVFVSDAHFGTSVNQDNLNDLVVSIKRLQPDLLLLGGDFYDEGTSYESKLKVADALSSIKTRYGTFAIEGNHEYKSGENNIDAELAFFANKGIKTLQDEVFTAENQFNIVGRKDPEGDFASLDYLMASVDEQLPVIIMDHRPRFKESKQIECADLQLSGHTHSGQFFPMKLIEPVSSSLFSQTIYGHHQINGLEQIVSSGVGNWGIPLRIGSKREIVNIKIEFQN